LALFLQQLWNKLNSAEIQEASTHIQIAWNLSESKIDKNNPPRRHENAENEIKKLWWIDVLAEQIWNLEPEKLKQFLSNLSQKIRTDWEKDKERWREGLSFQLLSASENLDSAKENY
jgi:hypothetical protein